MLVRCRAEQALLPTLQAERGVRDITRTWDGGIRVKTSTHRAMCVTFGTTLTLLMLMAVLAAPALAGRPPNATIALKTSSKAPYYTSTVKLTTTLKRAGKAVKNATITVQRFDGSVWKKVKSGKTSSKGTYAFRTTPYKNALTVYRAVYKITTVSSSVEVKPRAWLSDPEGPESWAVGQPFTMTGILSPAHAIGSNAVTIYLYWGDGESGPWTQYATFPAYCIAPSKTSNYSASVTIPDSSHKYWRFRSNHADADHTSSWSAETIYKIRD